jgi:hypothetical protein
MALIIAQAIASIIFVMIQQDFGKATVSVFKHSTSRHACFLVCSNIQIKESSIMFHKVFSRVGVLAVLAIFSGVFGFGLFTAAQDAEEMGPTCDSTLATLVLVAEFEYDYLSHMMMDEAMMAAMPKVHFGEYQPLIDEIVAMMMEMMEEGDDMAGEMTEEEKAMHDEMIAKYMGMSAKEAIGEYMTMMGMEMMADAPALAQGDVAGEPAECAVWRADVQKSILAHILTEISMMGDM